jgi:hypothetical protein
MHILPAAILAQYYMLTRNHIVTLVTEGPDAASQILQLSVKVSHIQQFSVVTRLPPIKEGILLAVIPIEMNITKDILRALAEPLLLGGFSMLGNLMTYQHGKLTDLVFLVLRIHDYNPKAEKFSCILHGCT